MITETLVKPFREIEGGKLKLNLHPGQTRVWESVKRFVFMLCGSQGGKTVLGPHWLDREIKSRGPGDYIAATSSYPLLAKKMLPELLYVFEDLFHYGKYNKLDKIFIFNQEKKEKHDRVLFPDAGEPTRIIIGSAQNPESLEAATCKAAWLDEVGQMDFRRDSWEAIVRRLAINRGRVLGTTTLYGLGWLKTEVYDPWVKGEDKDIDIIQFDSTMNPAFPVEEYDRLMRNMPAWKFDMFHRGRWSRPAGLIYDSFNADHIVKPFDIPSDWPRYVGHDFGTRNMAALWYAQNPSNGELFLYREYLMGGISTFEHVSNWISSSKDERIARRVGGSATEEGWRGDCTQAGWRIEKPVEKDVEIGIAKVYSLEKLGKKFVFNTCLGYLDEKQTYSRELDDNYEPTDKIENKSMYHFMDCERYILGEFATAPAVKRTVPQVWRW